MSLYLDGSEIADSDTTGPGNNVYGDYEYKTVSNTLGVYNAQVNANSGQVLMHMNMEIVTQSTQVPLPSI